MPRRIKNESGLNDAKPVRRRGRPKKAESSKAGASKSLLQPQAANEPGHRQGVILREISDEEVMLHRKRERFMFISIFLVMGMLVIVWLFNVQSAVMSIRFSPATIFSSQELPQAADKLEQAKEAIANLKTVVIDSASSSLATTSQAASLPGGDDTYNTNIDEVNERIGQILSSSSSSSINNK